VPDEATLALRRRVAAARSFGAGTHPDQERGARRRDALSARPPTRERPVRTPKDASGWPNNSSPRRRPETVAGCCARSTSWTAEIALLDQKIAEQALTWPGLCRLLTIPGVDIGTAAAVIAAVGDILPLSDPGAAGRLPRLDPKVRQSGSEPPRYGHISKRGNAQARSMLVEAAWIAIRSPGPLRAFGERVRARRGAQVAAVAVARKLVVLCWHLLSKTKDYAFARPSLTRQKTRRLELTAGASRRPRRHNGATISPTAAQRAAELQLQQQAELAYRRLVDDWRSTAAPKVVRARHRGAHLKSP